MNTAFDYILIVLRYLCFTYSYNMASITKIGTSPMTRQSHVMCTERLLPGFLSPVTVMGTLMGLPWPCPFRPATLHSLRGGRLSPSPTVVLAVAVCPNEFLPLPLARCLQILELCCISALIQPNWRSKVRRSNKGKSGCQDSLPGSRQLHQLQFQPYV